jgi:hypothetical protein
MLNHRFRFHRMPSSSAQSHLPKQPMIHVTAACMARHGILSVSCIARRQVCSASHLLDVASRDEALEGAKDLHDETRWPRTLHPDRDDRRLLLNLAQPLVCQLLLNQLQSWHHVSYFQARSLLCKPSRQALFSLIQTDALPFA